MANIKIWFWGILKFIFVVFQWRDGGKTGKYPQVYCRQMNHLKEEQNKKDKSAMNSKTKHTEQRQCQTTGWFDDSAERKEKDRK